jgi:hypothetical protein
MIERSIGSPVVAEDDAVGGCGPCEEEEGEEEVENVEEGSNNDDDEKAGSSALMCSPWRSDIGRNTSGDGEDGVDSSSDDDDDVENEEWDKEAT